MNGKIRAIRFCKKLLIAFLAAILAFALFTAVVNSIMMLSTEKRIFAPDDNEIPADPDTIIVLGCGIKRNGEPTDMLRDRLITAAKIATMCPKATVLLTGDHRRDNYDEIAVMKRVIIELGVDERRIDCDGYGLCTYDSMVRSAEQYDAKKALIITQKFHLARAVYSALNYGIDAYGVEADLRSYQGIVYNNMRELLARDKDFIINIFRKRPEMGDKVSPDKNGYISDGTT